MPHFQIFVIITDHRKGILCLQDPHHFFCGRALLKHFDSLLCHPFFVQGEQGTTVAICPLIIGLILIEKGLQAAAIHGIIPHFLPHEVKDQDSFAVLLCQVAKGVIFYGQTLFSFFDHQALNEAIQLAIDLLLGETLWQTLSCHGRELSLRQRHLALHPIKAQGSLAHIGC